MIRSLLIGSFFFISNMAFTQGFVFNLPQLKEWYHIEEGDTLQYQFKIINKGDVNFKYNLTADSDLNIHFDSLGNLFWIPSYDLVDRVSESKTFSVLLEAYNTQHQVNKELQFQVDHSNRPPTTQTLPVFYVKQYNNNEYQLNKPDQIRDPDGDPIVFRPVLEDMPQGASLTELGIFSWKPSRNQFRSLKKTPLKVKFVVQDQPEKQEAIGELIIQSTQLDLPPDILLVPSDSMISVKEDEVANLNVYVTDPNGDEGSIDVGFLSNHLSIPKESLTAYTNTQWEFKWVPGYDFIQEEGKTDVVEITFFAIDNSGKKTDKKIKISVKDAENIEKKDRRLYSKYRVMLLEAMNLIAQLDNNQKKLNKELKKAKKGKKHRSIINASLGAITGVSPVFLEDESKDYVTGIGGTAVLTVGTLEATEVIGRSKDDIIDKLKVSIDLRNLIQAEGDSFARKYALKSKRRSSDFNKDIDKLRAELNNKKLILLELDADWENPKKPTDNNMRKIFPDFNNEGYSQ